jgi:hypothetical protein
MFKVGEMGYHLLSKLLNETKKIANATCLFI